MLNHRGQETRPPRRDQFPARFGGQSGHYIDYSGGDPNTNDPADTRDDAPEGEPVVPATATNTVKRDTTSADQPNTSGGLPGNTTNADRNVNLGAYNSKGNGTGFHFDLEKGEFVRDKNFVGFDYGEETGLGKSYKNGDGTELGASQLFDLMEAEAKVVAGFARNSLIRDCARGAGRVAGVASIVFYEGGPGGLYGGLAGGAIGAIVGGAKLGAIFGSFVEPGIGTAIGAVIGGVIGGVAGATAGGLIDKKYFPYAGELY